METGIVVDIIQRRAGRSNAYDVLMDINGEEIKLGHGFDRPDFMVGDTIEFETSMNGKFENFVVDSIVVVQEGGGGGRQGRGGTRGSGRGAPARGGAGGARGSAGQGARQGGYNNGGRGSAPARGGSQATRGSSPARTTSATATSAKDAYWERKEEADVVKDARIGWIAAHNTAVSIVTGAVGAGLVALPKTKAEQWDAYLALVYKVAEDVHSRIDTLVTDGPQEQGDDEMDEGDEQEPYSDDIPE